MTETFAATTRLLESEVEDGLFTRGAQVSVWVDGEPAASLALGDDGTGRPMSTSTVSRVYCTIKPVTAVAVARQIDAGVLDLDEPLAGHLSEVRSLADGAVTLRHVLTHTAGLHLPMALELELVAPDQRNARIDATDRPRHWRVGLDAAYSEDVGWRLLGRLLEAVTGEPLGSHLRATVLDPLGMTDTWIGMTPEEYEALLPRLGVSHDMRGLQSYPLLLERGVRMCTDVNPAHGGYSTADDLARFYAALLAQLDGAGSADLPAAETLATFTSSQRPPTEDLVLGRPCEYGLGFMTVLDGHAFGRSPSPSAFGHSGNVGSSFAFADPAHDLAVAVVFNGLVDHESAFLRRPALVRAIYRDLDLAGIDDEPREPAVLPRHRWRRRR